MFPVLKYEKKGSKCYITCGRGFTVIEYDQHILMLSHRTTDLETTSVSQSVHRTNINTSVIVLLSLVHLCVCVEILRIEMVGVNTQRLP